MNFVATDLGASNTRFVSNAGIFRTMSNKVQFIERDENGVKVPDMNPIDIIEKGDNLMDSLEVIIMKDGESPVFPIHAVVGSLAERNSLVIDTPKNEIIKVEQRINYVSMLTSIAIAKINDNLENDIDFVVALPPIEVPHGRNVLKERLPGKYTINLPKYKGGYSVTFNIKNVRVFAESAMAVTSFMIDTTLTPIPGNIEYAKGNILSMDIGASTTDFTINKGMTYMESSGYTDRTGGNDIRALVRKYVNEKFGASLNNNTLDTIIREGRIPLGSEYNVENGVEALDIAKKTIAKKLYGIVIEYLRSINMSLMEIPVIIVSGGGSMCSQYFNDKNELVETTRPLSDYIMDEIKGASAKVKVVSHSDDPRMANVKGLYIMATQLNKN